MKVGIIGLGYVGLPLAHVFWRAGFPTIGFDIDKRKVDQLNSSRSYIKDFPADVIAKMNASGTFSATADFSRLKDADAVLICVPTPLTHAREPDLSFVISTSETISEWLKPGVLVVLESTTYPGTTLEVVRPILEKSGLSADTDFMLGFSPEREDPGSGIDARTITKIVGGIDERSRAAIEAFYGRAFEKVYAVRDTQTAEAVKITENVFRAVNIALVNELKVVYARMGIDIWEVIEAAKTKPYGYMPFYPGPGLGGHCIPIDPFYLSWKARQHGIETKFIELAGEINRAMPRHVIDVMDRSLRAQTGKALKNARVLVVGVAYKKNIDDTRESPALYIMDMLREEGSNVAFYDPYCPVIPDTREHGGLAGMQSIAWDKQSLAEFDVAVIVTDHDGVDYSLLADSVGVVIDTRNATKRIAAGRKNVIMA
ncbi:MAG: nucleotide sugar dehydrogenase [Rhizomicrobium sp.]